MYVIGEKRIKKRKINLKDEGKKKKKMTHIVKATSYGPHGMSSLVPTI